MSSPNPCPNSPWRKLISQQKGVATAGAREITALAQAKLHTCESHLTSQVKNAICKAFCQYRQNTPRPKSTHLRKDYAYLFERFNYFLEDKRHCPLV